MSIPSPARRRLRWLRRLIANLSHSAPPRRSPAPARHFSGLEPLEPRLTFVADFAWVVPLASNSATDVHAVAHDNANNTYIAGEFTGTVDFGQGVQRTSSGGTDAFVAEYNPAGRLVFAASFGGGSDDRANAIAVDAAGNIVVAGDFQLSMGFTNLPTLFSNGSTDAFVVAIANSPTTTTITSAVSFGGAGDDSAQGIAFNGSAVFVTGSFLGNVDFDPSSAQSVTASNGNFDGYVWASQLSGDSLVFNWARDVGGRSTDQAVVNAAAVGATGLFVAGSYNGITSVHGSGSSVVILGAAGLRDAFIAHYDLQGNLLWARGVGGTDDDRGEALVLDRTGANVFLAGEFQTFAVFNEVNATQVTLTGQGGDDVFVTSLTANGVFNWVRGIGGGDDDTVGGLGIIPTGEIFIAGSFENAINLDPAKAAPAFTAAGQSPAFLDKLSASGDFLFGAITQGAGAVVPEALALNAYGDIAIVGRFNGDIDFNPDTPVSVLSSGGIDRGFLLSISAPPAFYNEALYLASNPDVAANVGVGKAWRSGLEHFETYGQAEGRRFSNFFSNADYLALNLDVAANVGPGKAWASGFSHFLTFGRFEGRNVTPLFDERAYLALYPDVAANVGPAGKAWYSGYEHYMVRGLIEHRVIVPLYNETVYLASNPDVAANVGPGKAWATGFQHYLAFGIHETRRTSSVYVESIYLADNPDVAANVGPNKTWAVGLAHYLLYGRYEGRTAT
ncbi:MAG: hypothetical protein NTW19_02345 [Planctomycetota bacterium]|nr:hypothetical protein [Planctomycetota bacterium]